MRMHPGAARLASALLVVVALASAVAYSVAVSRSTPVVHDLLLGIAGPQVVSQAVAGTAGAGDRSADVRVLDEAADPATDVERGRLDAAVVIDLRGSVDRLVVPRASSDSWRDAVREQVGLVSAQYGRMVRIEQVGPDRGARGTPYALVGVWIALGVACAAAVTAWRGPVAATTARGAARLLGLVAAGLVLSGAACAVAAATAGPGLDVLLPGPWLLGAAVIAVVGALVLAAESLLGLGGLAVAVAVLLSTSVPLVSAIETALLPMPWRQVLPLTPQGAGLSLCEDLVRSTTPDPQPLAVLACWAVLAVLTLVAARAERPAGPA